ncbi:MAG: hypothetical protein ACRC1M_00130 [Methanobacteriaceae archaeon]
MDYKEGTVKKYKRQYTRTLKDGSKKQYTTEQSQVTLSKPHDIFENGEKVLVLKNAHRTDLDEFNKLMDDLKAKISNISSESGEINNSNIDSNISIDNDNDNISNENSTVNDNKDDSDIYDTIVALEIYNYILSSDNKEIKEELEEAINRNAELNVKIRTMKKIINSKNKNNNGSRDNKHSIHAINNNANNTNNTINNSNNSTNIAKSTSKSIEKLNNPIKDYKVSENNKNNKNDENNENNENSFNSSYSKSNSDPILDIDIKDLESLDFDEIIEKFASGNTINNTGKNLQAEIFKYKEEKLRKEYEYVYNAAKNEISRMQKHIRSFESQQNEKYNKLKAKYENVALERDLIARELETAKSKVSYLENINRKLKNYILR